MANEKRLIERIAERLKSAYPQTERNNLCPAIYYDDFAEIVDAVLDDIGASVDAVEVVHGNWINRVDNETPMHECSVCGARVVKGLYEYENPNRYCYHCGAKMDGGNEDG